MDEMITSTNTRYVIFQMNGKMLVDITFGIVYSLTVFRHGTG